MKTTEPYRYKTQNPSGKNKKILIALLLMAAMAFSFSSCSFDGIFEFQNENNTVTGTVELSDRISEDAKDGISETVLFVRDAGEDEVKNITDNMGLFWGSPTEYTILKADPEDNTLKIKFFIEKSNNYYVVNNYLNNEKIPEGNEEAKAISNELKSMMDEVIKDDMSDYEKELAIHDWLVSELEYDDSIDASSTDNGSYGGMVTKKTMCRGYAEAMKLISECCGLETKLIVGNAIDQDGKKVGHAWNQVKLDDKWYHMDATYDDPVGEDSDNIHHFYFNLNDTDIGKDHNWESDYFPVCDNDSYMYYKKNDLYYTNYGDFETGVKETIEYDKPDYVEVLLDADTVYESQLRFIFDISSVKSISWSTQSSNPVIVCITPDYY